MTEPREPLGAAADATRLDRAQMLGAQLLLRVSQGESLDSAFALLDAELQALGPHLRAVCRDSCYGALRLRGRLRAMLRPLLHQRETQPILLELLTVAAYQLLHTRTAAHAVVDHAVRAAATLTHPAVGGFVNAVLRSLGRQREALEHSADQTPEGRYSHPEWWIRRLRRDHPERWRAILAASQLHPPFTLRVNLRRNPVSAYLEQLAEAGLAAEALDAQAVHLATPCAVDALPGFAEGRVSVQDAAAQQAARLLAPQDGERVLDACAAPGGKTAHLLELADLELLALDHDGRRLQRVTSNLARLGLAAECACADAADLAAWWDGRPFDRILLDAPCTGAGVTRRHPDIRWLRQSGDPPRLGQQQGKLVRALWRTLKPGGTLLFATCSLFADEGPRPIASFLADHPDARQLPLAGPQFHDGWVLPDALHDGFFYALLRKT